MDTNTKQHVEYKVTFNNVNKEAKALQFKRWVQTASQCSGLLAAVGKVTIEIVMVDDS